MSEINKYPDFHQEFPPIKVTFIKPNTRQSNLNSINNFTISDMIEVDKTTKSSREQKPETLTNEIEAIHPTEINDEYGGRVFSVFRRYTGTPSQMDLDRFKQPEIREILGKTGMKFIFDEDEPDKLVDVLFPDPERIDKATNINDIPVHFETDSMGRNGEISERTYTAIVSSGKHPVTINNLTYYEHDITNDHMPAVVVCGKSFFDLINKSPSTRGKAETYDRITSNITSALRKLFEGDIKEFDNLIDVVCPGILNGYRQGKVIDNGVSAKLRQMIESGLTGLGIDHPNILK